MGDGCLVALSADSMLVKLKKGDHELTLWSFVCTSESV